MLINQTNISNSRLKGLDIHKDLILFLITEYDTHGKAAFNFNVVCLALRPFTPCCEWRKVFLFYEERRKCYET